jgi:ADP-ribosylglycohydrolase
MINERNTMTNVWSNVIRGVALGDSWGDRLEFQSIDSLTRDNKMGPGIPEHLRITDDTQMTLYLADALSVSWGEDMDTVKAVIAKAFLDYRIDPDNNRAPGNTVMGSLGRLAHGMPWQKATDSGSDGSGTVMRTSPTAFLPGDRWVGVTAYAAALTHGTANAVAAAILDAAVLRKIMEGGVQPGRLVVSAQYLAENPEEMGLLDVGEWLDGYEIPGGLKVGFDELARLLKIAHEAAFKLQADPWAGRESDPSLLITSSPGIRGGGWRSHETLVIALLAADMFPGEPWKALRRAVVTDGDSDTIGAVAGGLLGALYPGEFTGEWGDGGFRNRFEPRYIRWIEEADEYPFEGLLA